MKLLNLLMWVTQFGLSALFPLCFFLFVAVWLQNKFGLGMWIVAVFGILGFLVSISTVKMPKMPSAHSATSLPLNAADRSVV